jgi:hypothetical protein
MGLSRWAVAVAVSIPAWVLHAQIPAPAPLQIAEPPVPSDPLELVTGDAQPVTDAVERAQIIDLLVKAHRNTNVRAQPYDVKTTFTVSGSLSAGDWQEEDMAPSGDFYRWTVAGPGYSTVNLSAHHLFYSSQQSTVLPLRLMQVHQAIFRVEAEVGPHATLRIANASLDGVDLTCALVAHNAVAPAVAGGRRWEEQEWCVDPKAGTLVTFSEAPGSYVRYNYASALQFHGRLIPKGFTITQGGETIVEARTESVSKPPSNPEAYQPAGLNQIGEGAAMAMAPWEFRLTFRGQASGAEITGAQVVALHAMQSAEGAISDAEVIASSDPALNEAALNFATTQFRGRSSQTGATPQVREVLMILRYTGPQATAADSQ